MLPATFDRVPRHTAREVNESITRATVESLRKYRNASPEAVDARLAELDREWDIERAIEANAAAFSLFGLALAVAFSWWFLLLPAAVAGFLLQHALQGWCPPVPVLRRLGFRTAREILEERLALVRLTASQAQPGFAEMPTSRGTPGLSGAMFLRARR
jgi:hypothetical protein